MKKLINKLSMCAVAFCVAAVMAGCSSGAKNADSSGEVEYYQTHEDSDITRVHAKMFTGANKTEMGDIKFHETDAGLKMDVKLSDLRPGVEYKIAVYKMNCDKAAKKCTKGDAMDLELPTLKSETGKLEESFVIRGLTAKKLMHTKLVLQREGNDRAAWGKTKKAGGLF